MLTLKTKLIITGILMTAGLSLGGEMASGSYTVAPPTNVCIWDASGTYSESLDGISIRI